MISRTAWIAGCFARGSDSLVGAEEARARAGELFPRAVLLMVLSRIMTDWVTLASPLLTLDVTPGVTLASPPRILHSASGVTLVSLPSSRGNSATLYRLVPCGPPPISTSISPAASSFRSRRFVCLGVSLIRLASQPIDGYAPAPSWRQQSAIARIKVSNEPFCLLSFQTLSITPMLMQPSSSKTRRIRRRTGRHRYARTCEPTPEREHSPLTM